MLIVKNIKKYKEFMGISNAQIARDLNVNDMAVSRFFSNENPKYEDLMTYSKYFGVNLNFFENDNFDPSVMLGLKETEEKIYFSDSLNSHDKDVLETVENIVELFKHLNVLIMDYGMRL